MASANGPLIAGSPLLDKQANHVLGRNCHMNGLEVSSGAFRAQQVYRWDFNVFEYSRKCGDRPLTNVTLQLLEDQQLLDGWLLDRATVERYLTQVEQMYRQNPYHNNTHAADVTQTAGVIMKALDMHLRSGSNNSSSGHSSGGCKGCKCCPNCCCAAANNRAAVANSYGCVGAPEPHTASNNSSTEAGLSKLERFAIILASAVHDLGHPGVNNVFLVKTRDKQALTYNDRSVNENMHASLAFTLALENDDLNLFKRFSTADYEKLRKLVVDMVLSTDMDVHFELLEKFSTALAVMPNVQNWSELKQRSLLFQMLVHLADLANPSRPWILALTWAERVVTEFMQQGEREAKAGIPVSDFCNREKVCMPAAQLFFIERFMQPTLEAFKPAAPGFFSMAMPWLADTKAKWAVFKDAGVRLPKQAYPVLQDHSGQQQQQLSAVVEESRQYSAVCCPGCCKHRQAADSRRGCQL